MGDQRRHVHYGAGSAVGIRRNRREKQSHRRVGRHVLHLSDLDQRPGVGIYGDALRGRDPGRQLPQRRDRRRLGDDRHRRLRERRQSVGHISKSISDSDRIEHLWLVTHQRIEPSIHVVRSKGGRTRVFAVCPESVHRRHAVRHGRWERI